MADPVCRGVLHRYHRQPQVGDMLHPPGLLRLPLNLPCCSGMSSGIWPGAPRYKTRTWGIGHNQMCVFQRSRLLNNITKSNLRVIFLGNQNEDCKQTSTCLGIAGCTPYLHVTDCSTSRSSPVTFLLFPRVTVSAPAPNSFTQMRSGQISNFLFISMAPNF